MTITTTKINHGPATINYLAVERVSAWPRFVYAVAKSRMDVMAAVLIKKEAFEAARSKREEVQVSVEGMCGSHSA